MKNVQIAHGLSKAADRLGQTSDIAVNERRSSRRWSAASSSEDGDAPRRPSRSMSILKSAGELLSAGLSVSGPASDQDLSLLNPESPQGAEKEEVAPVVAAAQAPMQILEEEATLDDAALENDRVLGSLKKPPSSRTDEDLQVIKQATADVKFFERLSTEEHHELCRVIEHTYLPKGHTIFEQGDEGSTFYIIYMGAAKVYVAYATAAPAAHQTDPKPLRSLESFNHPFSAFESDAASSLGRSAAGAPAAAAPPAAAQPLHKLGTCVCLLEDGDSFGELALMGNGVRQASIETAMDTHLLKIDKDVYEQSLHKLHEAELQLRMVFLRGVFIFSDWSDEDLRRISYVMTSRRYEKNKTIIAQGDHTDSIFFLKEGGCRVLKRMQISQRQQEMLGGQSPRGGGRRSPRQTPKEEVLLEIGDLGVRQYFGELAMLDKRAHSASVVSASQVEVLILSKYDFYHLVDMRTQELMQAYAKKFYFDEASIRKTIQEQHDWQTYRRNLVLGSPRASAR